MNQKKYGDPVFGSTLADLKKFAELTSTVNGISVTGNAKKIAALLAVVGCAGGLIQEIESLTAECESLRGRLDSLLNHCPDAECKTCAEIICDNGDPMHFHHDGCPSCSC